MTAGYLLCALTGRTVVVGASAICNIFAISTSRNLYVLSVYTRFNLNSLTDFDHTRLITGSPFASKYKNVIIPKLHHNNIHLYVGLISSE